MYKTLGVLTAPAVSYAPARSPPVTGQNTSIVSRLAAFGVRMLPETV